MLYIVVSILALMLPVLIGASARLFFHWMLTDGVKTPVTVESGSAEPYASTDWNASLLVQH